MPVVLGFLFAIGVGAAATALVRVMGFLCSSFFGARPVRRWIRQRLIHSYTCRTISRRMGSSLVD
jgi:hypothetical protein